MIGNTDWIGKGLSSVWSGIQTGAEWVYEGAVKYLPGVKGTVEAGKVLLGKEGGTVYIETGSGQEKLYSSGPGQEKIVPNLGAGVDIMGIPLKTILIFGVGAGVYYIFRKRGK